MFKKNDYVIFNYDGEDLMARILEINGEKAKIEICLSVRRGEETLTDIMDVSVSELRKIA